jgi:hypothetical protein
MTAPNLDDRDAFFRGNPSFWNVHGAQQCASPHGMQQDGRCGKVHEDARAVLRCSGIAGTVRVSASPGYANETPYAAMRLVTGAKGIRDRDTLRFVANSADSERAPVSCEL